jgi:3-oxoacyl-[acyl-carrier-protein] synthase-3
MKLDKDKVFINIEKVGNTVSSSIPIALKDALDQGRITKGSKIILSGFGVGLSYGSILMEY